MGNILTRDLDEGDGNAEIHEEEGIDDSPEAAEKRRKDKIEKEYGLTEEEMKALESDEALVKILMGEDEPILKMIHKSEKVRDM